MAYTGTPDEIAFKQQVIDMLRLTELRGVDPLTIRWAGINGSGWSFGVPQFDIANNQTGAQAIRDILINAQDSSGNFIVDDHNPATSRSQDTEVTRLLSELGQKNGQGLPAADRNVVNNCLHSAYATGRLDTAYDTYLNTDLLQYLNSVERAASASYASFVTSNVGKLLICDFANQYGKPPSRGAYRDYFSGLTGFGYGTHLDSGLGDALNVYLRTSYNKDYPWDGMFRFATVVQFAGGIPSGTSLDTAAQIVRAFTFAYLPNESSFATTQARLNNLALFRSVALAPAKKQVIDYLNSKYTLSLSTGGEVFWGDDNGNSSLPGTLNASADSKDDVLVAGSGSYKIVAGRGSDVLIAGAGNDSLIAGAGSDTLIGGAGNNTMFGHSGSADKFVYSSIATTAPEVDIIEANGSQDTGTVYVGSTQLKGPGANAAFSNLSTVDQILMAWVSSDDGTRYQYKANFANPSIGTLTISQGALGSNGGQIVIDGFDMEAAQSTSAGYLGIHITKQIEIEKGTGGNTFSKGDYSPSAIVTIALGTVQPLTLFSSASSSKDQTITLTCKSGDASLYMVNDGAHLIPFTNGTATLTIPAGADSVTVGLVYKGDPAQSQTVELTSTLVDPANPNNNAPVSNSMTVTFDNSQFPADPNPATTITGTQGTRIVNGVETPYMGFAGDDTGDLVVGSTLNNAISAGNGSNSISGGAANDTIHSGNGNSVITGAGGRDIIQAGNGNNRIYAQGKLTPDAALSQTGQVATHAQGDFIAVGNGNNTIVGGLGNDFILTGTGNNFIVLGPGDDTLQGGSSVVSDPTADWSSQLSRIGENGYTQTFSGFVLASSGGFTGTNGNYLGGTLLGVGNDTIFGGSGNAVMWLSNGDNYVDAGTGNDVILAGAGHNTIFGGTGNDTIHGGAGDSYIDAESGNDLVLGVGGNDTIYGGSGNSTIYGGLGGTNWATSSTGNSYIEAGTGDTKIYGGGGKDTLVGGTGNDTIRAGDGDTTILGGSGNDFLYGGAGNDVIDAGDGGTNGQFTQVAAGTGATTVYGGNGTDHIFGGSGTNLLYAGDGGTAANRTFVQAGSGATTIHGGAGVDSIVGGSGTNLLYAGDGGTADAPTVVRAGSGATTVYGGAGIDQLIGGSGDDVLYAGDGGTADTPTIVKAGDGNDTLVAGSGSAQLVLGTGNNTILFDQGNGNTVVSGGKALIQFACGINPGDLTYSAQLYSDGTSGLVIQYGNSSTTIVGGLTGNISNIQFLDPVTLAVADAMRQGSIIPANLQGTSSDLLLSGDDGDLLVGATGNDTIYGLGAGDTLVGGIGSDLLVGGGGNDIYQVDSTAATTIQSSTASDTLQFSAGIHLGDVHGTITTDSGGSTSATLRLSSGGTVVIQGNGSNLLGRVSFADGTTLTLLQLLALTGGGTIRLPSEDGSYSITSMGAQGSVTTTVYSVTGVVTSDSWWKTDGSHGTDSFNADGTGSGQAFNRDGSYSTYTDDGYGDRTTDFFDVSGTCTGSTIAGTRGDGSVSTFTYSGPDGTGNLQSESTVWTDGSSDKKVFDSSRNVTSETTGDGQGNYLTKYFDSNGLVTSDSWIHNDGSYGTDTFGGAAGNSSTAHYPDGHYVIATNDGKGDTSSVSYDATDRKFADSWTKADGSHGSDTFNADGSSGGTTYQPDGSYTTYTDDGHGHVLTTSYDANGQPVPTEIKTTYADGTYRIRVDDGQGDTTFTLYDSHGNKVSDSWSRADGSHGADAFGSDGSSQGTAYRPDGSYSTTSNDAHGQIVVKNYSLQGVLLGSSTTESNGLNSITSYANASGTPAGDTWVHAGNGAGSDPAAAFDFDGIAKSNAQNPADALDNWNIAGPDRFTYINWQDTVSGANGQLFNEIFRNFGQQTVIDEWSLPSNLNGDGGTQISYRNGQLYGSDKWLQWYWEDYRSINANIDMLSDATANTLYQQYGDGNPHDFQRGTIHLQDSVTEIDEWFLLDGTKRIASYDYFDPTQENWVEPGPAFVDITLPTAQSPVDLTLQGDNGSYALFKEDGLGNQVLEGFDVNDKPLDDVWFHADGSFGMDRFNADGTEDGVASNPDGTVVYYHKSAGGEITLIPAPNNNPNVGSLKGVQTYGADGYPDSTTYSPGPYGFSLPFPPPPPPPPPTHTGSGGGAGAPPPGPGGFTISEGDYIRVSDGAGGYFVIYLDHGSAVVEHYNAAGHLTRSDTDPSYSTSVQIGSNKETWTFDAAGRPASRAIDDGHGSVTTWLYDAKGAISGHTVATTASNGAVTTQKYDAGGHLTNAVLQTSATAGAQTTITTETRDAAGVLLGTTVERTDGQGDSITSRYDAAGAVLDYTTRQVTGTNQITTTTYNAQNACTGIQIAIIHSDGTAETDYYDGNGQFTSSVLAKADSSGNINTAFYDASGNLTRYTTSAIDGSGNVLVNTYGAQGVLQSSDVLQTSGTQVSTSYGTDGSSIKTTTDLDGSFSVAARSASGDLVTTRNSAQGDKLSDIWSRADGTSGADTFNPDGTSTGTVLYVDGTTATSVTDDTGQVTTTHFSSTHTLIGSTITAHTAAETITREFDANGKPVSDTWVKSDGSSGSDIWNGDGTVTQSRVNADGSHITFTGAPPGADRAPTLSAPIADQSTASGSAWTYAVPASTFVDPDAGDTLTYTATLADGTVLPSWLAFDAQSRTFSGTPLGANVGSVSLKITATDTQGMSAADVFGLTVSNGNHAPTVAQSIPNQATNEDQSWSFAMPAGTFADVDAGDTLTYTAKLGDGSALPSWLAFDPKTATFTGTPGDPQIGTLAVTVTATDTGGLAASSSFNVTINGVPPTVANAIADQSTNEDAAFRFVVPASTFADSDPNDALTYSASLANGTALPSWLTFDATTRTFSGTPDDADIGSLAIKVTATDPAGLAASASFNVAVNGVAPTVAHPPADQTLTDNQPFTWVLPANTFADTDPNDVLVYSATLANGSPLPTWLSFDAKSATFSGTPGNSDTGSLAVKVTATDPIGLAANASFNLVVTGVAPTVVHTIANQTTNEDAAFHFAVPSNTFAGSGPGDTLTYSATLANGNALPSWLTFDAATSTLSGTPDDPDIGTIAIKVIATDSIGLAANTSFDLTVNGVAPTLANPISNQTAGANVAFHFSLAANTFVDSDPNDALTYTATLANGNPLPGWLRFDATSATFSGTPGGSDSGTITVKVVATDPIGLAVGTSFNVTVDGAAPTVANPIANQSTNEDAAFRFAVPSNTFAGNGPSDTLVYSATLANGSALPSWLTFNAVTSTFSGTPDDPDIGTIAIKVTATDAVGLSTSTSFNIAVNGVAPALTHPLVDQTATKGTAFALSVTNVFADADPTDSLTYSATLADGSSLPQWLTFNASTGTFSGTPGASDVGTYSVTVKATDPAHLSTIDTFHITVAAGIVVTGGSGNVTLNGSSGDDTLIGGSGTDTMIGGLGNDIYVINNSQDVIVESANQGNDTVQTSVTYVLPANVENLLGTGSASIKLTGNSLDDLIVANAGNDTLVAGSGNDTLVAGAGVDTLIGGSGNDTFVINNVHDVIQAQTGGINTVQTSVSYTAGSNIRNVIGTGTAAIALTGGSWAVNLQANSGNDTLTGGSGDSYLAGLGTDTLIGGSGTAVLQAGTGGDLMKGGSGKSAFIGGAGNDSIQGGAGNLFAAGGVGNDAITLASPHNVVAFNAGDGQDVVAGGGANVLSLGGGIEMSGLTFSKNANDLTLSDGKGDSITFQNWYLGGTNHDFVTLQVIEAAAPSYNPASSNVLYNQKVETFDFGKLVTQFDAARAANPSLTSWTLMNGLLSAHLAGSDTQALGGDLAYYYGTSGLSGMDVTAAQGTVKSTQFGSSAQTVDTWQSISQSATRIQ
jgi:Ca2+-binding RTX toxin-like protein